MLGTALLLLPLQAAAPPADVARTDADRAVVEWLRTTAVPFTDTGPVPAALDAVFKDVRVVGLGEATHGQHEAFELKRKLTMYLVEKHGFRIVAYEASSALARACDDYIAGRTADPRQALDGLGMMIWMIEENADLLDELRAWNKAASPKDQVRFIGIDVQDSGAAAKRLCALLAGPAPDMVPNVEPLGRRIDAARAKLYAGDSSDFDELWAEIEGLRTSLERSRNEFAHRSSQDDADEACARAVELSRCMSAARTPSGRDRAMADTLLDDLARAGDSARAVVWSHNAHVSKGPMRYMQVDDPAMGGVLREKLGAGYYAVGVLFGEGGFHALAVDKDRGWGFRGYELPAPPPGSLEAPFVAAALSTAFVDLRTAPKDDAVKQWIETGHGRRWFGGYNIQENYATRALDAEQLMKTVPSEEYDGLVFLARTTPSRPRNPASVLPSKTEKSEAR